MKNNPSPESMAFVEHLGPHPTAGDVVFTQSVADQLYEANCQSLEILADLPGPRMQIEPTQFRVSVTELVPATVSIGWLLDESVKGVVADRTASLIRDTGTANLYAAWVFAFVVGHKKAQAARRVQANRDYELSGGPHNEGLVAAAINLMGAVTDLAATGKVPQRYGEAIAKNLQLPGVPLRKRLWGRQEDKLTENFTEGMQINGLAPPTIVKSASTFASNVIAAQELKDIAELAQGLMVFTMYPKLFSGVATSVQRNVAQARRDHQDILSGFGLTGRYDGEKVHEVFQLLLDTMAEGKAFIERKTLANEETDYISKIFRRVNMDAATRQRLKNIQEEAQQKWTRLYNSDLYTPSESERSVNDTTVAVSVSAPERDNEPSPVAEETVAVVAVEQVALKQRLLEQHNQAMEALSQLIAPYRASRGALKK